MEAMRKTWTDSRMDDLSQSVDKRFEQVDKRFEQVHQDINQLRAETNRQFASLNRRFDLLVGALLAASLSGIISMVVS